MDNATVYEFLQEKSVVPTGPGSYSNSTEMSNALKVFKKNSSSKKRKKDVNFYDYDGTLVDSYSTEEFLQLSKMPANPSHKGLEAQGWNYALDSAKEYVSKYGKLNVGQVYITDDGKTRIYISLKEGRLSPRLGLGINGSVVVDWGDGSETDTMTGSDTATTVYQEHIYSAEGDYVIMLDVTGTAKINGDTGSGLILGKVGGDNLTNRTYLASITRIEIGESITIGERAFSSCYSLTSIIIPEGSVDSSDAVFNSCRSLASITIPEGVTSIGAYAFNDCHSLASVTIPEGVTSIGADAFSGCCSLSGITLPESLTNVGGGAFAGCSVLTRLVLPNGVTSINDGGTFTGCYSLTSITLPETLTSIGTRAFYNCYSLSNITIPDGVTSIGAYAFYSCYSLASIILPEGVTSIGDNTFYNCYSLRTIELPETLTSIGTNAFYNCWTLTSLTIPESISSFKYAFFGKCNSLGFLKFERETPATVSSRIVAMWSDLPTDCIIYVPQGSLSAYTSANNYPDPSTYTYMEY